MTKQVVKGKETKAKAVEKTNEDGVVYLQFPQDVNVIQINRMTKPVFIPQGGMLEVQKSNRELLEFCKSIEGVIDITNTINAFRK